MQDGRATTFILPMIHLFFLSSDDERNFNVREYYHVLHVLSEQLCCGNAHLSERSHHSSKLIFWGFQ